MFGRVHDSRNSIEDYLRFREVRADEFISDIEPYYPLAGRALLEVGCGYGCLASRLANRGARVTAVEPARASIEVARQRYSEQNIDFIHGTDEDAPQIHVDAVLLFDVIEHVAAPEQLLERLCENHRRPTLILEYNPYYSLVGHHLYDYTLLPVQYMPTSIARMVVDRARTRQQLFSKEQAIQQFLELNRLTSATVKRTLAHLDYKIVADKRYLAFGGAKRFDVTPLGWLPLLGEMLTFQHFLIAQPLPAAR